MQTIANCSWALTSSRHASRSLVDRFAQRAYHIRDNFTTQELSMWFMSVIPYTTPGSYSVQHLGEMEATAVQNARTLDLKDRTSRNSIGWLLYVSTFDATIIPQVRSPVLA